MTTQSSTLHAHRVFQGLSDPGLSCAMQDGIAVAERHWQTHYYMYYYFAVVGTDSGGSWLPWNVTDTNLHSMQQPGEGPDSVLVC